MPQSSALQQATLAYERAQITYATQVKGPTDDDLAVAYAQVQQATMTLEQAKQKLEQAKLIAPMAGTITALTCQVGDYLAANTTAVNLTDLTGLQIKVPVAELDVAQVAVGQSVVVTVDALPNTSLTGAITYVAPVGTITQGVVTYSATVTLDKTDAAVRPGMTAAVTIVVSNREQVLLVPNRAISTSNGRSTVTVMKDGQASSVQVTIGLRNESYTEITDGLQEGNLVVVNGSSVTSTQASGVRGLGIPGLGGGSGAIMRATGN